jgi:tyrosyl-tRNA synthetase
MQQEAVQGLANPRDFKIDLALEITERFHTKAIAQAALQEFKHRFKDGAIPTEIKELSLTINNAGLSIANLLKQAGLVASTSEALRAIDAGAVKIDAVKITDRKLSLKPGATHIYQVGKRRFAKVTLLSD